MSRTYLLLIFALLTLSIIPPLAQASPLTQYYIGGDAAYESTIAYTTYGNYAIYGYTLAGSGNIVIVVVDNTSSIVLKKTLPVSAEDYYKYVAIDLDANDTGILVAYRTSGADVYLYWVGFDGSEVDLGALASTSNYEGLPIVKYGNGYWLLAYVDDTTDTLVVGIYDTSLNKLAEKSFGIGPYGGVDYRERAFYDPVTQKFYIVVKNNTIDDLTLVIADPSTLTIDYKPITTDGSTTVEGYAYYGKLFRKYYSELLGGGGKLLVVYGYYSGSTNLDARIIDLTTLTNQSLTIADVGTSNPYPWISASNTEWLVTWSYSNNIYAMFIYPNGTTTSIWTLAMGQFGYIVNAYNGVDYTIVYGNQTTGDYDLYAIRLDTIGKRSSSPLPIAHKPGYDEKTEFILTTGTYQVVFFFNYTGTYTSESYIAVFDLTEVPEPTAIPTEIVVDQVILNDGGDNYMESGDYFTISGTLIDTSTGSGLAYKKINAYLYRYIFYNTKSGRDEDILVATASGQTNDLGNFNIDLYIPADAKSGIYYIKLEFPGEDPYAGTTWSSTEDYGYFPVVSTKPAAIMWETIPTEISRGPALLVKNGQVIITDPTGEVSTDNRYGVLMSDILGGETDDVDVESMRLSIDSNYLYVKVEFAGDATASGDVAPVLAMAFDFTPENLDDGYRYHYSYSGKPIDVGRLQVVFGMGYTDTYLKSNTSWDWTIVATPKDYKNYVFTDNYGKYTLYMYIAFEENGRWYVRELDAGYVVLNGNTMEIYAPLDIVKEYNPHILTNGLSAWKMFAAVYAVNLTTGKIVGAPGANWFDVPGIVTTNSTPTNYFDLGATESPLDDKYGYDYELDTYFILNINWSKPGFFAYTKVKFVKTYLDVTRYGRIEYDEVKAFMGTNNYLVKLVDANNTLYGVYGKTVKILVDGVAKSTATTSIIDNVVGMASIPYKWLNTTFGTEHKISFAFDGDNDYIGTVSTEYTVKPVYLVDIVSGTATLINNDNIPTVSQGDVIKVTLYVDAWYDDWIPAPTGLKFKVYLNSTPYYLGEAVVTSPGVAELSYTVTGDEGLYDYNYTTHEILVYKDPDTTWIVSGVAVALDFPYSLGMIPTPEPPILPLLLLVGLLLLLFITKKK